MIDAGLVAPALYRRFLNFFSIENYVRLLFIAGGGDF
jgi:hypothetical protein